MFLVDTSPPMGTLKTVELPGPNGEVISKTTTHLEHALQFVKLKVQDMVCCIFDQTSHEPTLDFRSLMGARQTNVV